MNAHAKIALTGIALSTLLLAGCFSTGTNGDATASSSSSDAVVVTPNVNYIGTIEELSPSIYQQGTHQLRLADGRIVFLATADAAIDLTAYIGMRVEVHGSVQPTVEAGGSIMTVSSVTSLDASSSSSSSAMSSMASSKGQFCGGIAAFPCPDGMMCVDDTTDSCDPNNGGADCGGVCVKAAASSSKAAVSSAAAVSSSKAASSVASSMPRSNNSAAIEAQIVAIASQKNDASQWTQKYCTTHIGFCIPAHKNWYYKSFGATTSNMWHIEFANQDFENLGEGVIVLNLVSGSSADAGAASGQVKVQGSDVVGYKDWQDGKHFELVGDARLRAAIEYMLNNIEIYAESGS